MLSSEVSLLRMWSVGSFNSSNPGKVRRFLGCKLGFKHDLMLSSEAQHPTPARLFLRFCYSDINGC